MGIAGTVTKEKLKQTMKENFVLEKLSELGVTKTQQGVPVHELSYEDMKYELVLASFREIDIQKDENRWF
ncbi:MULTISPECIES: hypothetical protein [unclassified Mesobacillus]|uniref:hypothetical protein n=1 Tax=unclassified Mesobacillus TaxID=2675270 RepID=UPI00203E35F1|nr:MULTISPECIES: hypothetical protein [unclassified Mesobacillus]MCM3122757.1 hypothetical protein [Mesobacillus sp. MER 33]MCM3232721.1 hypothetical protein [Mesobacillus sp. MER 48]